MVGMVAMSSVVKGNMRLMNRRAKLNKNESISRMARAIVSGQMADALDKKRGFVKMKKSTFILFLSLALCAGYYLRWLT